MIWILYVSFLSIVLFAFTKGSTGQAYVPRNSKQGCLGRLFAACYSGNSDEVDEALKYLTEFYLVTMNQLRHCIYLSLVLDDPIPVIRAIKKNCPDMPLTSLDNYELIDLPEEALEVLYDQLLNGRIALEELNKMIVKLVDDRNEKVLLLLLRKGILDDIEAKEEIYQSLLRRSSSTLNINLSIWAMRQSNRAYPTLLHIEAILHQIDTMEAFNYFLDRFPITMKNHSFIVALLEGGSIEIYQYLVINGFLNYKSAAKETITEYCVAILSSRNPKAALLFNQFRADANLSKEQVDLIFLKQTAFYGGDITHSMFLQIFSLLNCKDANAVATKYIDFLRNTEVAPLIIKHLLEHKVPNAKIPMQQYLGYINAGNCKSILKRRMEILNSINADWQVNVFDGSVNDPVFFNILHVPAVKLLLDSIPDTMRPISAARHQYWESSLLTAIVSLPEPLYHKLILSYSHLPRSNNILSYHHRMASPQVFFHMVGLQARPVVEIEENFKFSSIVGRLINLSLECQHVGWLIAVLQWLHEKVEDEVADWRGKREYESLQSHPILQFMVFLDFLRKCFSLHEEIKRAVGDAALQELRAEILRSFASTQRYIRILIPQSATLINVINWLSQSLSRPSFIMTIAGTATDKFVNDFVKHHQSNLIK